MPSRQTIATFQAVSKPAGTVPNLRSLRSKLGLSPSREQVLKPALARFAETLAPRNQEFWLTRSQSGSVAAQLALSWPTAFDSFPIVSKELR